MQLNDAVPERRNLIVFCMATIIFFIGGGDACGGVKLPFGGIILSNNNGLIFLYWAILTYLILRYWSVFKSTPYDSESTDNFQQKKNWKVAIQEAIIKNCDTSNIKIPHIWYIGQNTTEVSFSKASEHLGFTSEAATKKIAITRKLYKEDKSSYYLTLSVSKGPMDSQKIWSEKITIRSRQHGLKFLTALLKRGFSDKYLFDWVFPWLILIVTLLTMAGSLYAFDYSLCPPTPISPDDC